jgi:ribosomal protein S18 acetylase RimI-like enzyme
MPAAQATSASMPTIRTASRTDLEAIATLHVSSWQSAYRGILPDSVLDRLSPEERVRDWSRWLATPDAQTFAAIERRRLVGFTRVLPGGAGPDSPRGSGEISHLYVAPDSQSMGVGQALLTRALEDIVARGLERAVLWVLEKNYRARAFYERAGFRLDGARRTDPELLGSDAPEVRYQISIPATNVRR